MSVGVLVIANYNDCNKNVFIRKSLLLLGFHHKDTHVCATSIYIVYEEIKKANKQTTKTQVK